MQSQDETLLKNIPKEYELMINSIQDETISKLYSKINFQYLKLSNISFGQQITDDYNDNVMFNDDAKILYSSINRNFSTIEIKNSRINATNIKNNYNVNKQDYYPNSTQQIVNVIICNEFKCTIIEGIRLNVIKKIIDELKKEKASIIDVTNSKVEIDTREEIKNFRFYFRNEINNNKFVNYTISPIIIYMIRRFFYPRDNFFDRSFFDFNPDNNKNILDSIFLHRSQEDFYKYINKIVNKIREINKKPKENQDFQENDFIILRQIYFKDNASFNLVMHIKSFHIFMMKKILYPDKEIDEFNHEINFCKNYSHRCFTPFYGFVKNKQKIIAFIYKFMVNSTLASYLKSNSERSNDIFILTTINRISQGLEYLQSNYLIHRDLKPSNILIDNDHIPYISDFDTIRSITNKNGETEKMTVNIGSMIYASPEQHNGGIISYPTDIYSFGQIIYFLFNNMNSKLEISGQKEKNQLGNIIKLYEECVETNPKMRPEMSQIKSIIIDEISSFVNYEKCMLNGNVNILVIKQFIYENIFIMMDNPSNLDNYFTILFNFINLFEFYLFDSKSNLFFQFADFYCKISEPNYLKAKEYYEQAAKNNNSAAINKLGDLYYDGKGVEQDYSKAKEYYESAAALNNSDAINKLGNLYYDGKGVKQDYLKAKEYYELAVKNNSSATISKLGDLYYYGKGVEQDYSKAKEYYEQAIQYNEFNSYINLGNIYCNGKGVKQSIPKAIECYELAIKNNIFIGYLHLGYIYKNGFGVPINYFKAKECYELALQHGDFSALFNLGELYYNGQGVEQNYLKAKKYYKLSSEHCNSVASNKLGDMYFYGKGIKQNYSKAIKYYEISALIGNFEALFNLGRIYLHGHGVKKDYKKAKEYLELAAEKNCPDASFYLGDFYSSNEFVDIDYSKSISYFQKCIEIQDGYIIILISKPDQYAMIYKFNNYRDRARNDLGLLYKFDLNDQEKANEYIIKAGCNEYPFAQNNLGLLNQLYNDNINEAMHFYEKSSKNHFALAEYNIGYLKEKNGDITDAIEYYIKASDDEDCPLLFRGIEHNDKRLSISQMFIICLVNMKLAEYYLMINEIEKSKQYFIKAFRKFNYTENNLIYHFHFVYNSEDSKISHYLI